MKFWDSSAIAPLLLNEPETRLREALLLDDPEILVWYGSLAELESAICRRRREGSLADKDAAGSRASGDFGRKLV